MADAEQWDRVKAVFQAALECPPHERAAFLREACGPDAGLRAEVESLLSAHEQAGSFVARPAIESLGATAARALEAAGRALRSGDQFGPYEVTDFLAAGSMGEVYRARDSKLGRSVAIKILPPAFTRQPERLARFQREARLLAALSHPHIGAIYELAEAQGLTGLVLELIDGESLAERLRQGPVPVAEALPIARQVADALEAAHEKGIIHRDLKPANIRLTPEGVVKVLDFGIAKGPDVTSSSAEAIERTQDGVLLGTAAYMSPEQARGRAVDKRADIWAFGCVVYELLAGRAPFAGETISDTIAAILGTEPDWDRLPLSTPPRVRRLLERCLEKDLRRRLRDVGDARVELEDALAGEPALAEWPVARRTHVASRWTMWVAIAILALAAVGAVFVVVPPMRERDALDVLQRTAETTATRLTDYGGTESASALAPDGRAFAFVSDHGGTPDIWVRQVFGGDAVRLTNDASEETALVYARDGETIFFTRRDAEGPGIWRIGALGGEARKVMSKARMPAPSPDGRRLAYLTAADPADLEVADLTGGVTRTLARGINPGVPGGWAAPAWSPNGRWIAYNQWGLLAPHNLFVIDVATGASRQVTRFTDANEGIALHAWLPDSRHLAVWQTTRIGARGLGVLDIEDGSFSRVTLGIAQQIDALSASSDGSRLLATVFERRLEVWKVPLGADPDANGRAAVRLVDSTYAPWWTSVSRDGRTLLLNGGVGGERNLWTMPLDPVAPPRPITVIRGGAVTHSALSPDGSHVAFASSISGTSKIWSQNIDGADLRQLTTDDAADHWPAWSPDGQWIVFGSELGGNVRETRRVPAQGGPVEKVVDGFFRGDWIRNPDGPGTLLVSTTLPTAQDSGGLRVLDFERRAVLWEEYRSGTNLTMPTFSPDGRLISQPFEESRDRSAISIFDTATGRSRLAVRFPGPFLIDFRAGWSDGGAALVVNRREIISHVVLFDRFWTSR